MEANAKLLKKKRVAHMGNKLSKSNFDEQKLPPDDFVYNIMKDMDTKNVISYKQSQEVRRKRDLSINEGQRSMNSSAHDSYCNKQVKKVLSKKSFPLMKKCQTSLKYLKKNRCIPKPRAHVGFVPKPQAKPVSYTEQEFECGNSSKVKPKIIQSKAYSKIFQSDFLKNKSINVSAQDEVPKTGVSLAEPDEVAYHSSSDDDGAAFESFVQKVIEEGNDSSDSDSRLIIQRKRSRNKSKQKKKKPRSKPFFDENNTHVTKITSIPLSDSSESQSKETFEVHNKSSKRKTDSPAEHQKRVCNDTFESYNSESSRDPLSDMDNYNNNSSDEDFGVDAAIPGNETVVASDVNIHIPNVNLECKSKLSNCESSEETSTLNKHRLEHKPSSNPADLNSTEIEAVVDLDTTESNDSCRSETTKSVPKYEVPCYVRLKRDPILDEKALTFSSTVDSSEDDCILIEDSDDEKSTTSHSMSSSVINKTCQSVDLSQDAQSKGAEIQKSQSDSSSSICDSADEVDDCVIMCEMPKVGLNTTVKESNKISNSLCSESLSSSTKPISTNSDISNVKHHSNGSSEVESLNLENLQTITGIDDGEQSLNVDKTAASVSFCHEDGSKTPEEFNVQIVAVQSLVESSSNPLETNAAESKEIEVIDLSDDDLDLQETIENKNSEDGKELVTNDNSKITVQEEKTIQPNEVESISSILGNKTCDSTTLLSEHHNQTSCENSAVQEHNMPDPKILEILSKINFDCIKEVLNRTKLMDSKNKSSKVENFTSNNALLPIPTPTTICGNVENAITTNIEAFEERNSKTDRSILDKRRDSIELITEVGSPNSPSKSLKRNDSLLKLPNSTIESSCISSSESAMESSSKVINSIGNLQTTNLNGRRTDLATDLNTKLTKNNCIQEKISLEIPSSESKTFQMVNAENRTETSESNNVQENKTALDSKPSSENTSHNNAKTNTVCCDTTICNSPETTDLTESSVPNKRQPNSKTCVETVPLQNKISQGKYSSVPDTVNTLKHEDFTSTTDNNKVTIKCEIPESPSDDLDTIATAFIQDLNPPNKKVISLINLYKTEYAKYMQIKNTEVNVSAGLKLLHENQVKKLAHLRSSIQNLVKHDPCFYKVVQGDAVKTSIVKSEIEDKLEKKISGQANSSKEREGGTTTGAKLPLKFDSAGTSRENLLRLLNMKCAECGKPASARCQGCAEVYYCSPHCGELSWKQGHYAVCKR